MDVGKPYFTGLWKVCPNPSLPISRAVQSFDLMPLAPGTRLGHYEILAPLGAGGMGEVYRASDTQLGRDVALKVLPATFLHDPDRMGRFQREAQVLASTIPISDTFTG